MFSTKNILVGCLSILGGVAATILIPKPFPEISRQDLIEQVRSGYVQEVVVTDGEVITGTSNHTGRFRVRMRRDAKDLTDELSAMGVTVKYETEPLGLI